MTSAPLERWRVSPNVKVREVQVRKRHGLDHPHALRQLTLGQNTIAPGRAPFRVPQKERELRIQILGAAKSVGKAMSEAVKGNPRPLTLYR